MRPINYTTGPRIERREGESEQKPPIHLGYDLIQMERQLKARGQPQAAGPLSQTLKLQVMFGGSWFVKLPSGACSAM
jgi:hypothetical protein